MYQVGSCLSLSANEPPGTYGITSQYTGWPFHSVMPPSKVKTLGCGGIFIIMLNSLNQQPDARAHAQDRTKAQFNPKKHTSRK